MKTLMFAFAFSCFSLPLFAQSSMPVNNVLSKKEKQLIEVVEEQICAFNANDLESYLSFYSDEVKVYHFPDLLLFDGKTAFRNAYAQYFQKHPQMFCEVTNRIVVGNKVIDEERVSNLNGRKDSIATAIYEIKEGKIVKVYLIYP